MQLKSAKNIVCVLQAGKGSDLIKLINKEKNIITSNLSHARGTIKKESQFSFIPKETDIVTVLVDQAVANEVFEFIYHNVKVEENPGCFMYQANLTGSSEFSLPEVAEE